MACKNRYAKSCVRGYNNNPQVVTAALTTLNILGTPVVDNGCSLDLNTSGITVDNSGLYHFSADVIFTPTGAETLTVQLYKDGVALPCAIAQVTTVADTITTLHVETDLCLGVCCANKPVITVTTSGVAGTVNSVCMGGLKLA